MISFLKRWAFVPLLALLYVIAAGATVFGGSNVSIVEAMSGLLIVPPLAFLIDRRRRHPRPYPRRLTFWT
ncbi:MAG: hypothetical protein QOG80_2270 [Pseudonocardiales bacterium]|jgi:hypothetical protein|nr:hypothetical protein [Pseudonocardiales bacterium]